MLRDETLKSKVAAWRLFDCMVATSNFENHNLAISLIAILIDRSFATSNFAKCNFRKLHIIASRNFVSAMPIRIMLHFRPIGIFFMLRVRAACLLSKKAHAQLKQQQLLPCLALNLSSLPVQTEKLLASLGERSREVSAHSQLSTAHSNMEK